MPVCLSSGFVEDSITPAGLGQVAMGSNTSARMEVLNLHFR